MLFSACVMPEVHGWSLDELVKVGPFTSAGCFGPRAGPVGSIHALGCYEEMCERWL